MRNVTRALLLVVLPCLLLFIPQFVGAQGATIWSADIDVSDHDGGSLSTTSFSNVGGTGNIEVTFLWYAASVNQFRLTFRTAPAREGLTLHLGELALPVSESIRSGNRWTWRNVDTPDWVGRETVQVRLVKTGASSAEAAETPVPTVTESPAFQLQALEHDEGSDVTDTAVPTATTTDTPTPTDSPTPIANCSDNLAGWITQANADPDHDSCTLTKDIMLAAGLPDITSPITFEGDGFTISGEGTHPIFDVASSTLVINNMTLSSGYASHDTGNEGYGGAIRSLFGTIAINNSTFRDNTSEHDGGAIDTYNGTLSITGSSFTNNSSAVDGGAIKSLETTVTITNTTFSNNSSSRGNGGAVFSSGTTLSVTGSSFIDNTSSGLGNGGRGGAISFVGGDGTITASVFSGNTARRFGGAIMAYYDTITHPPHTLSITNSTFNNNSTFGSSDSSSRGGAIYIGTMAVTLKHVALVNNSAASGGGLYNSSGKGVLNLIV